MYLIPASDRRKVMYSEPAKKRDEKDAEGSRERPDKYREQEDFLDWLENQRRSEEDCSKLDRPFLGGMLVANAPWLIAAIVFGGGSVGGLAVLGHYVITHHFRGH
jgi:hypothetical protein